MTSNTIKELSNNNRPYEKFMVVGAESLLDEELLAIILRSGTKGCNCISLAKNILNSTYTPDNIIGLQHLTYEELLSINGIGKVKATQIICLCELSKRMSKSFLTTNFKFTNSKDVASYYMEEFRYKEQEELHVYYLNSKNILIKSYCISKGTVNESFAPPREIFIEALKARAVNMCLIHNHPSGDPTPSKADLVSTKRIKESGNMLGITLIDHIVIGDNKFISFNEQGLL